ncbi:Cilia- and flagella-associated protein 91 [Sparganum proliferum]
MTTIQKTLVERQHDCLYDPIYSVTSARDHLSNEYMMAVAALRPAAYDLEEPFVNRSVQTIYRDSEAQTDPYSPPYTVKVGDIPEVLSLSTLTYGHGLPAGQKEVEMIERARERRQLESNLLENSQLTGAKLVAYRKQMLDDAEMQEWARREKEIEELQAIRLQVLAQLLRTREENHQTMVTKRLDRLWNCREQQKQKKLQKIHFEYAQAIRKLLVDLEQKRKPKQRDKINEYANPGSQAFAPLTRVGIFHDRGSERFVVRSQYLSTYSGLLQLESGIPESMLQQQTHVKPPSKFTKDGFLKRPYRWQAQLEALQKHLLATKHQEKLPPKPLRYLERIEKPLPRPPTPTVADYNEKAEQREAGVLELQRILRGRAVQTMMCESRMKRKDLIDELRSTHALLNDDRAEKRRQMILIRTNQTRFATLMHEEQMVHEVLTRMEATTLGEMLDFLSKELDRLIVERRLHAFAMLANRERRMREAEESGRRQKEERRRRQEDEYFRQIVKVHQDTVDSYFRDIAEATMDSTADLHARNEYDAIGASWVAEQRRSDKERTAEEEASDLVYNFLIPEVCRRAYREKLKRDERKYLSAAHHQIFGEAQDGELGESIRNYTYEREIYDRREVATATDETSERPPEEVQREGEEQDSEKYMW